MIEINAKTTDTGVAIESHMDGTGIKLLAESTGLIRGLIEHFEKCNLGMEFALMATTVIAEYAGGKMGDDDEEDDNNEYPIDFDLFSKFIKDGEDFD